MGVGGRKKCGKFLEISQKEKSRLNLKRQTTREIRDHRKKKGGGEENRKREKKGLKERVSRNKKQTVISLDTTPE